jgi:hypothetical protein
MAWVSARFGIELFGPIESRSLVGDFSGNNFRDRAGNVDVNIFIFLLINIAHQGPVTYNNNDGSCGRR